MNILIVGEFSAFAKHLKKGFVDLGHFVKVITKGDSFKGLNGDDDDIHYRLPSDISIWGKTLRRTHVFLNPIENIKLLRKLDKYSRWDIIFIINPVFVSKHFWQLGLKYEYLVRCKSQGAKIVMFSCGSDPAYDRFTAELRYYKEKYPNGGAHYSKIDIEKFDALIKLSDLIIPIGYDYRYAIQRYCEYTGVDAIISHSIPLPITIGKCHIDNCVGRKIVIFHGIIREDFKGTAFFREALERIKTEFGTKVEIIIDGKIPYEKYVELLERMDILLDQTNSYGMGINCELGLMQGKVVLGGNEPENSNDMGIYDCPVINVVPDANYIYTILKDLILNPEKIMKIKYASREFAEKRLKASVIAQQYLNLLGANI